MKINFFRPKARFVFGRDARKRWMHLIQKPDHYRGMKLLIMPNNQAVIGITHNYLGVLVNNAG